MENWIIASLPAIVKVVLSIVAIYIIMILLIRISGLRTFAKMSSIDFASTIAIGSVLAAVVMNNNQSIFKGATALAGIVLFQKSFAYLVRKFSFFKNMATNDPKLLMKDGVILYENLEQTNIGKGDLIAKLREANVLNFSEVHAVVLESTGDMSVLHSSDKNLQSDLLYGVSE
ncbi:DUF421 domain-containing protein [Dokdonia sp. Hel_I_53]|uniref:DUF421 domain-containing protein n=1 Tax=Dokdonia sp. Hel_I_53 TaxID=1566287 RepID=UPI00119BDACD|nr:YetF domain-containing protein [Dokdonia sp. Hel_I_53]TVZ51980.1 uncharacterized protein DUF421 [Dokdonia sp. Hel_I_53]